VTTNGIMVMTNGIMRDNCLITLDKDLHEA